MSINSKQEKNVIYTHNNTHPETIRHLILQRIMKIFTVQFKKSRKDVHKEKRAEK